MQLDVLQKMLAHRFGGLVEAAVAVFFMDGMPPALLFRGIGALSGKVDFQPASGLQVFDTPHERASAAFGVSVDQVVVAALQIGLGFFVPQAEQGRQFRGEQEATLGLLVIERLDAEGIPRAAERLFPAVIDDKGKHAYQHRQALRSPLLPCREQDLGIGIRYK
jgi:hypothetical protein